MLNAFLNISKIPIFVNIKSIKNTIYFLVVLDFFQGLFLCLKTLVLLFLVPMTEKQQNFSVMHKFFYILLQNKQFFNLFVYIFFVQLFSDN